MNWSAVGLSLGLTLGLVGIAQAKTVSVDFTGANPAEQGLKLVNATAASDGAFTIAQKGGKNVAATGGTDAARYLYFQIDPAFKQGLKSVWVSVEYFDEGKGGFKLQYDGQGDPLTTTGPNPRVKFDTKVFTSQTWHLVGFKLQGGQTGGADFRIDDRAANAADGPEFIARVTVSDEDPDFVHIPYAVTKITIDGKADAGEWDGAKSFKLDRPELDVLNAAEWGGPQDFSGTYSFKWDENAMYVLGQVTDATPRYNTVDNGVDYWAGDDFELFLGLNDSNPERTAYLNATDFQVLVGLGEKPGWSLAHGDDMADVVEAAMSLDPIGNNFAIMNTADGYVFELQVPWKLLKNATVTPGQRIGWYMFAGNSREPKSDAVNGDTEDVAMSAFGRPRPSHDPSRWARGMLDPKPAQ